jgi:hypothetical protein
LGSWGAAWQQRRRWRANGAWERAMAGLAALVRIHARKPAPSMVMIDAPTVKGGRYGPTFHQAGGPGARTIGTKWTVLVKILGLLVCARADPAAGSTRGRPPHTLSSTEVESRRENSK